MYLFINQDIAKETRERDGLNMSKLGFGIQTG